MVQLVVLSPLRFKVRLPQEVTPVLGSTLRLPCVAESGLRTTITWKKECKLSLYADTYFLANGALLVGYWVPAKFWGVALR